MMHDKNLRKTEPNPVPAVVLCRVESSGNVGAICRAMATMGFHRLILANCPAYDHIAVRTYALAAWDIYEQAERFSDLDTALSTFSCAVAFSRRGGRKRKEALNVIDWLSVSDYPNPESVALVFGNEKHGLDGAELNLCDEAVFIPSDEALPSLNVSHAVQVALWEWRRFFLGIRPQGLESRGRHPASRRVLQSVLDDTLDKLAGIGFFTLGGRADTAVFLRELTSRAALSELELEHFQRFLCKHAALSVRSSSTGLIKNESDIEKNTEHR